jgi:hypothetical protein
VRESAIKIQKVWRGYLTRKLLARFIEEEEERLERKRVEMMLMRRNMAEEEGKGIKRNVV